jgi:hypothetical protein
VQESSPIQLTWRVEPTGVTPTHSPGHGRLSDVLGADVDMDAQVGVEQADASITALRCVTTCYMHALARPRYCSSNLGMCSSIHILLGRDYALPTPAMAGLVFGWFLVLSYISLSLNLVCTFPRGLLCSWQLHASL